MPYSKLFKTYFLLFVIGLFYANSSEVNACVSFYNFQEEICPGNSFDFNGKVLTDAGIYSDTVPNYLDCDSIITLVLIVKPQSFNVLQPIVCFGSSFQVGEKSYSQTGTYLDTLQNYLGCDSIISTTLTVLPLIQKSETAQICSGKSYSWNGEDYTQAGIYRDTLKSSIGCDSVVILNLSLIPPVSRNISVTICSGDSYTVGVHHYSNTGNYTDTLIAHTGCDSIVFLNLVVLPEILDTFYPIICAGESFQVGNHSYSVSGIYRDTLLSTSGCDSIVVLNLNVATPIVKNQNIQICQGQTYAIGTHHYTTSGVYSDTLLSYIECDSVVITTLTVSPTYRDTIYPNICQGSVFQVGNHSYTQSGTYKDTLSTISFCDSIITTVLTVSSVIQTQYSQSLCEGSSYNWNGEIFTQSGVYKDTLNSSIGCDSVITLTLHFVPVSIQNISAVICSGATYSVGNQTYSSSGNYSDTLLSHIGCDSIVHLNLTVLAPVVRNINSTICQGQVFQVGDSAYMQSGNYSNVLAAYNGCDSTVNLHLVVASASHTNLSPVICKGSFFQVGNKKYTSSGTYNDTLLNQNLCDSIIITQLTVKDPTTEQISITICPGQSVNVGQNTYTQQGIYRDTLHSVYGCDSIIVLRLFVSSAITYSQTVNICEGETYSVGQHIYNSSGTFKDTLLSSGGCDSIVTTQLFVREKYNTSLAAGICLGDSVILGAQVIKTSGTYSHTFQSIYGCDSVVTMQVEVLRSENTVENRSACQGDIIKIQGKNYNRDTTFILNYTNQVGCDSTIEYRLKFYPTYHLAIQQNICQGKTYQNIIINKDTTLQLNLNSIHGCDSIVTVHVHAIQQFETYLSSAVCYGSMHQGVTLYKDTILKTVFNSYQGCDSLVIDTVKILSPVTMSVSSDTTINPGNPVTLFASGAESYLWSTGATSASIVVKPTATTTYTVTGTASNGCKETVEIQVNVNSCTVEAATYFTPNGDGSHDTWKLQGTECLSDLRLKIINRWGNIVFESDDVNAYWDGNYKEKPAPEGVYFYIMEGLSEGSKDVIHQNGYIHLNR